MTYEDTRCLTDKMQAECMYTLYLWVANVFFQLGYTLQFCIFPSGCNIFNLSQKPRKNAIPILNCHLLIQFVGRPCGLRSSYTSYTLHTLTHLIHFTVYHVITVFAAKVFLVSYLVFYYISRCFVMLGRCQHSVRAEYM